MLRNSGPRDPQSCSRLSWLEASSSVSQLRNYTAATATLRGIHARVVLSKCPEHFSCSITVDFTAFSVCSATAIICVIIIVRRVHIYLEAFCQSSFVSSGLLYWSSYQGSRRQISPSRDPCLNDNIPCEGMIDDTIKT